MNIRKLGFASLVVLNLIAIGVSAPADQVFNAAFAAITGGSINNTPIGATTASTGRFTTLTATGLGSFSGGLSGSGGFNFGGNATISTNSATAVTSICAGTTTGLCTIGGGFNTIQFGSNIILPLGLTGTGSIQATGNPGTGLLFTNVNQVALQGNGVVGVAVNGAGQTRVAAGLDVIGTITLNGAAVVASKTCIAATATLTIVNGLVTATSGC